jgi:hypothetical protein
MQKRIKWGAVYYCTRSQVDSDNEIVHPSVTRVKTFWTVTKIPQDGNPTLIQWAPSSAVNVTNAPHSRHRDLVQPRAVYALWQDMEHFSSDRYVLPPKCCETKYCRQGRKGKRRPKKPTASIRRRPGASIDFLTASYTSSSKAWNTFSLMADLNLPHIRCLQLQHRITICYCRPSNSLTWTHLLTAQTSPLHVCVFWLWFSNTEM